jgi:hypothetical protein
MPAIRNCLAVLGSVGVNALFWSSFILSTQKFCATFCKCRSDRLQTGNTILNFIKSNFAATNFNQAYTQHLNYKIPFSVSRYELERYAFAGVMIGGFGVWFSGVLLISIALLFYIMIRRKNEIFKTDFQYYFFLIVVFASVVINPYCYIALQSSILFNTVYNFIAFPKTFQRERTLQNMCYAVFW